MSQEGQISEYRSTPFSASEMFVQSLANQVNQHDVDSLLQSQKHMLLRFEKTNEMLLNCNALSAARFTAAAHEFKRHTQHLLDMKKDLDSVFRRIRTLRTKLATQYPAAFEACSNVFDVLEEEPNKVQTLDPSRISPATIAQETKAPQKSNPHSSSCSQTTTPSPITSPSTSDTG